MVKKSRMQQLRIALAMERHSFCRPKFNYGT